MFANICRLCFNAKLLPDSPEETFPKSVGFKTNETKLEDDWVNPVYHI